MKLIFLLLILICTASQAQTKQETVEWINSKSKAQIVYGDIFKASQKIIINYDGSFEIICTDYEVPFNSFKPETACVSSLKGNFKNFSPNSVTIEKRRGGLLFINIKCLNGSNCIKVVQSGGKMCPTYDASGVSFGAYYDDEENIGPRLKKAFTHLILLTGGKSEAF